jgi:hypothetical protein
VRRIVLPLLVIGLLAGGWWFLARGKGEPPTLEDFLASRRPAEGQEPSARTEGARDVALAGRGDPDGVGPPSAPSVDVRLLPRGDLVVRPVGPDGAPLPPESVNVTVEGAAQAFHAEPLGTPDYETGRWTFRSVLAGDVRVRVTGDHVQEATVLAIVPKGQAADVDVRVKPGGAVRFRVWLPGDAVPPQVTLSLLDARRQPVRAWFQARGPEMRSAPRAGTRTTLPPEGVVYGIAEGRYHLEARGPEGGADEATVDVVAGKTIDVVLRVPY